MPTDELTLNVLERAQPPDGIPVVLVRGIVSSSLFSETMQALPPIPRHGTGPARSAETTRPRWTPVAGCVTFADDLYGLLEALQVAPALGRLEHGRGSGDADALEHPVLSLALQAPVSPYGFGGTAGPEGRRLNEDDAGTGGGGAEP